MLLVPSQMKGELNVISIQLPATGVTVPEKTCVGLAEGTQSEPLVKSVLVVLAMYTTQSCQVDTVVPPPS